MKTSFMTHICHHTLYSLAMTELATVCYEAIDYEGTETGLVTVLDALVDEVFAGIVVLPWLLWLVAAAGALVGLVGLAGLVTVV